jgi:hypothetical protein
MLMHNVAAATTPNESMPGQTGLLADSLDISLFISDDGNAAERLAVITALWAAPELPMKTAHMFIGIISFPELRRNNRANLNSCTPTNSRCAMNRRAAATQNEITEMFRDLMVFDRGGTPKQRALVKLCMDRCLLLPASCSADERLNLIRTLWIADIPLKTAYTMIGLVLFPEAIGQLTED